MLAALAAMGADPGSTLQPGESVVTPEGVHRNGASVARTVFGPTCDSVDRLPGELPLAGDIAEGDYVMFYGMGAYTSATNTRFNGFGNVAIVTVLSLKP